MAKLFPPYIEGTLPAFYQNNDGTATIAVPFVMNRGVSFQQINGFMMKIKSIQSSTYLYSAKDSDYTTNLTNDNYAYFNLPQALSSDEEERLTNEITTIQNKIKSIENKIAQIEVILQLYKDLNNLSEKDKQIQDIKRDTSFYKNRIAEIKHYYNVEDSTQNKEIASLEAVKRAKIAELGTTKAYYDIQNIDIAKNFYKILNSLESELANLESANEITINEQIAEKITELIDDNYREYLDNDIPENYDANTLTEDANKLKQLIETQNQLLKNKLGEINQFTTSSLRPGLYYKVQLAYIDKNNDIGQYSTVGVIKYTTRPEVGIEGLSSTAINTTWHNFVGYYTQQVNGVIGDTTERAYSYQFDFYDENHNLIETSGSLLHNSSTDSTNNYYSSDSYYFAKAFDVEQIYYAQYTVTTQNGLVISSPEYAVMEKYSKKPLLDAQLNVQLNYDNGYIDVWLIGRGNEQYQYSEEELEELEKKGLTPSSIAEEKAGGSFIFARACSDTDYSVWEKIFEFTLMNEKPTQRLWRDYTVEQGKSYKYSLQQFNKFSLFSSRLVSDIVFADFEDMFLSDGDRQLKIRFNPKVSSFKNDVLEQKIDTIGSKYPFIFRNGNVYYKEFQISGLISRLMDEEELFFNWDNYKDLSRQNSAWFNQDVQQFIYGYANEESEKPLIRKDDETLNLKTNITSDNIYNERKFKLEVLEWLNNGEPKIFRSPVEGNYIVRLLNVSLSPNDTLGRMLHTFQCTAYEVDDFKYETLQSLNFLHSNRNEEKPLMWKTKKFYEIDENGNINFLSGAIINKEIISFRIEDCQPGEQFSFILKDTNEEINITIGATGQYLMNYPIPIKVFNIKNGTQSLGQISYSFYEEPYSQFDDTIQLEVKDILCQQFICNDDDESYNIMDKILKLSSDNKLIDNRKISLNKIHYIKILALTQSNLDSSDLSYGVSLVENINDNKEKFLKVREKPYFIPIRNLTQDDIKDLQLFIYPNTEVQIGYQMLEETFNGETNLREYNNYIDALNNYSDWIENVVLRGIENKSLIDKETDKNVLAQNINEEQESELLANIQQTKKIYHIAVAKMLDEKEASQREKEQAIQEYSWPEEEGN